MNAQTDIRDNKSPIDGGDAFGGKALIVRQTGHSQTLAEKVTRAFYMLTWRTPLHNMRLTGKLPLRLLAVPTDPLPAHVPRGQAVRMGKFRFHGLEQSIPHIDYDKLPLPPAMTDYIHRFEWLRDLAAATNRADGAPIAAAITEGWIAGNSKKIRPPAWRVDNCAWRLLNMAAWAPLILSSSDPVYRSSVLNHIARNARHLDRSAPRGENLYARLTGWAGVVAASLLLPEGKARRIVGEAGLSDAIDHCVFDDGGVVSRSPLQLMELIGLLSLLRQCYLSCEENIPDFLSAALGRAVPLCLASRIAMAGLARGRVQPKSVRMRLRLWLLHLRFGPVRSAKRSIGATNAFRRVMPCCCSMQDRRRSPNNRRRAAHRRLLLNCPTGRSGSSSIAADRRWWGQIFRQH